MERDYWNVILSTETHIFKTARHNKEEICLLERVIVITLQIDSRLVVSHFSHCLLASFFMQQLLWTWCDTIKNQCTYNLKWLQSKRKVTCRLLNLIQPCADKHYYSLSKYLLRNKKLNRIWILEVKKLQGYWQLLRNIMQANYCKYYSQDIVVFLVSNGHIVSKLLTDYYWVQTF